MTIVFQVKDPTCISLLNLHRYERVKGFTVFSYQWYDTKGQGKDIFETILCFDGKELHYYEHNLEIERLISLAMTSKDFFLDLTNFEAHLTRAQIPGSYKKAERVV